MALSKYPTADRSMLTYGRKGQVSGGDRVERDNTVLTQGQLWRPSQSGPSLSAQGWCGNA
eukprot:2609941-Pyramimonas_sp.AAC.1